MLRSNVVSLALTTIALAGCGSRVEGPATVPVTGEVTLDGQIVAGADVTFIPQDEATDATPAQAVTDEAGRFEVISQFDQGRTTKPGLQPGAYAVQVTQLEQPPTGGLSRPPKNLLPAKYAAATSSGLNAEVTVGGENHFLFPLTK